MKTFLSFACLLLSFSLHAQLAKKNWQIGGNISFSDNTSDLTNPGGYYSESKSSSFVVTPAAGLFVTDHLVVGLNLSYATNSTDYFSEDFSGDQVTTNTKSNTFSAGPFVRYYKSLGQSTALFIHSNINFGTGNYETKSDGNVSESSSSSMNISLRPGFSYFLSTHWGIEATIGELSYFRGKAEHDNNRFQNSETTNSGLNLNMSMSSMSLGIQYYLNR